MATLEQRNGWYRLVFRYDGKKVCKSLKTQDSRKANVRLAYAEQLLKRIRLGEAVIPSSVEPISYIVGEGTGAPSPNDSGEKVSDHHDDGANILKAWDFFLESIP